MLHVHSFRAPGGWWGGRCGFALFFFIRRCVQIERGCAGGSVILLLAKCARDVVSERQKKIQKGEEKASHGRARVHAKQTAVGVGADVDLSPRVLPLHKKKKKPRQNSHCSRARGSECAPVGTPPSPSNAKRDGLAHPAACRRHNPHARARRPTCHIRAHGVGQARWVVWRRCSPTGRGWPPLGHTPPATHHCSRGCQHAPSVGG